MAVFTRVSTEELQTLLAQFFDSPEVVLFEGISAGIENTNYFVDVRTSEGVSRWVLTLFEMVSESELPVFVTLTQQLAAQGMPVPAAKHAHAGYSIAKVAGKPCILVPRVTGKQLDIPSAEQCRQVGVIIGRLHQAARRVGEFRDVVRNQCWLEEKQAVLDAHLAEEERHLLADEINYQRNSQHRWGNAPTGWIHGDLFVDNILFDQGSISGIIDFYHACHDYWLVDLAVACNDWCYVVGRGYDEDKMRAFLQGYQEIRTLTAEEREQWSHALRLAALRFWISRLVSLHAGGYQNDAEQGEVFKNPDEMKAKLLAARMQDFPC